MTKAYCSIPEQFVNPLFEVFDGGDFVLSSYRDIEQPLTEVRVFYESGDPVPALKAALGIVGVRAEVRTAEVPDEDWRFAYRRHFRTELVSPRILVQPDWEELAVIRFDPGMAFGTGKHETTRACLQYVDELGAEFAREGRKASFLDMGCGSGILSIAAAKLGYGPVVGFDVDPEAGRASVENAAKNAVSAEFLRHALGRFGKERPPALERTYDLVVANILGPLLIRFADEIAPTVGGRLVVSGILGELYPEVLAAYAARGFREVSHKAVGEWTTGLLARG